MDVNEAVDASKENIQPLKEGRKATQLSTALLAQTNSEKHQALLKERYQFEIQIRSYEGDDPLQPWYDYINWTEQSFPKHGREGNLQLILEKCLSEFKDVQQYTQDLRYIKLWIKFIDMATNPLELYQLMYGCNIGTECSLFYYNWAEEFAKNEDFKRADQVYVEGIKRNAQPIDELINAHNNFQLAVARHVLSGGALSQETSNSSSEQRLALSRLQPHGKNAAVTSVRTGSNLQRSTPGVLQPLDNALLPGGKKIDKKKNVGIHIYSDENGSAGVLAEPISKPTAVVPKRDQLIKENAKKPERWNEVKLKHKVKPVNQPAFEVHVDENAATGSVNKVNNANIHVLKPRKLDEHISCPVALFESPNPKRRPMYAKHKVYTGGMEFSIEELRAIVYNKRYEEQKAKEREAKEAQEAESRLSKVCTVTSDSICEENIHVRHGHIKSNTWLAESARSSRDVSSSTVLHEKVVYNKNINLPKTQSLVPEVADRSTTDLRERLISKEAQISPFSDEQLHQNNYSNNSEPFVLNSCETDFENNVRTTSHCNIPSKVFEYKCVSESQEEPENVSPNVLTRIEESKALHSNSLTQERTSQSDQSNRTPSFELYVDDEEEMEKKIRNAAIKKKPKTKLEISKQPGLIMQRCTDPVEKSLRYGLKRPRKMHELSTIQADVSEREPSNHLESNSINAVEQSFTVNTKAAMNLMQDLWKTPEARRIQPAQLLSNQNIPKFTIHMDDSVVQKESEFSKNVAENKHCVVPNTAVAPFKVLSDPREREMGNSAQVNVYSPQRDVAVYSDELPHKMYSEIPHMKNQIPINDASENRQRLLSNVNLTNPSRIPFQVVTPLQQREEVVEATGHEGQCDRVPVMGQNFDLLSATETASRVVSEAGAVPHETAGIPFVPSPGMTPAELDELQDLGDKENVFSSVKKVKEGGHRMFAGILQPSQRVPFIPLEEQEQHVPEEEEDNLGVGYLNEFPMSNETCTTQAFSYPLPSSTPFIGHFRNSHPHGPEIQNYEGSFIVQERVPKKQDDVPQAVAPYSLFTQTQESISALQQREPSRKCSIVPNLQLPHVFVTESKKPNEREFSQGPSESSSSVMQNAHASVKENVPLTVTKENSSSRLFGQTHQHMAKSHATDSTLTVQCSTRVDSLSTIMETSKEYKSSSSSGSCSTTTSHRTPSHWGGALSVGNLATITENSVTYEQRSGSNNEHLEKSLPVHEAVDQIAKFDENVVKGISELKIDQDLDPFVPAFTEKLLSTLGFPLERHMHHLVQVDAAVPRFKASCSFTLGDDDYVCNGTVGEGAYAKVIKAKKIPSGRVVALKIQKPACWWEYYIAEELHIRLNDPTLALRFMSVDIAYFLNNGSVMVIEFSQYGSLISVINTHKERTSKNVPQMVTIYWTAEMLLIMEHLHKCGIIHADIKPDNFIVRRLPESSFQEPSLQLIDFGRAIDMTLLPPGTTFSVVDKTKCFQCIEMKMNEPWTYQIDIFRMAGTVHCILFGDYMKVDKKGDKWFICKSIPRYYDQALWRLFFTELLNIRSCDVLPDLSEVKLAMQQKLDSNTNSELRDFKAVVGDS